MVEWQTRTFEGRVAQAVRVQVPPSAPTFSSPTVAAYFEDGAAEGVAGVLLEHLTASWRHLASHA